MNTSVDIDLNDPAILALQQSFAEAKEKKDTNQSVYWMLYNFITDLLLEQFLSKTAPSSHLPKAEGARS